MAARGGHPFFEVLERAMQLREDRSAVEIPDVDRCPVDLQGDAGWPAAAAEEVDVDGRHGPAKRRRSEEHAKWCDEIDCAQHVEDQHETGACPHCQNTDVFLTCTLPTSISPDSHCLLPRCA